MMMSSKNIVITKNMKDMAKLVYDKCLARENLDYMIALEIYEQLDKKSFLEYIPFRWEMEDDVMKMASEVTDLLFKEYLKGGF
jgi:HD-like signal output (HDOD) protein